MEKIKKILKLIGAVGGWIAAAAQAIINIM